ncbi:hypothetical protein ASE90_18580 [Sphingomonas sp. Leaf67]|uniref:hypothetical protein n=1 Tax=Sphingomonas sp. Leaf67 TaxID=1736230 RepID=UPI000712E8F8|nr:hypothetical protein [Sphingomonas sp. Leaf67]KQN88845.1 hypothetical protein ASE90_18580 [Sphingomonas sp. Leaf67]
MLVRNSIIALLALTTLGCSEEEHNGSRWIVLIVPLEKKLVADNLISGTGEPSLEGPFPDATGLTQALYKCGQLSFDVINSSVHDEAAAFRSNGHDLTTIKCVAKVIPADFTAAYTSDPVDMDSGRFEFIRGI